MWYWVAKVTSKKSVTFPRRSSMSPKSPDGAAFALRAHAAPSGECNYYVRGGSHATEFKGQQLPTFLVWLEVPLKLKYKIRTFMNSC